MPQMVARQGLRLSTSNSSGSSSTLTDTRENPADDLPSYPASFPTRHVLSPFPARVFQPSMPFCVENDDGDSSPERVSVPAEPRGCLWCLQAKSLARTAILFCTDNLQASLDQTLFLRERSYARSQPNPSVVASGIVLFARPCKTFPGPISRNLSAPRLFASDSMSVHRTGLRS